ncbi:hypothetical protein H4218_003478 [Coemansia sp. IMI 209128]|nr:hypothetical protein H4218_003478 [Coemansia sp. IMI 209128]
MVCSVEFLIVTPSQVELEAYTMTAQPNTESNIRAFAQKIKQVTPRLKHISIKISSPMVPESQVPICQFNSLIAQLSQHVAEIAYKFDDIPFTIDQKLSELTSIYFMTMDTRIGGKQVVQLVLDRSEQIGLAEIASG